MLALDTKAVYLIPIVAVGVWLLSYTVLYVLYMKRKTLVIEAQIYRFGSFFSSLFFIEKDNLFTLHNTLVKKAYYCIKSRYLKEI